MNQRWSASTHVPVLRQEAIEALGVRPGGHYIDCTLGGGGHAAAILERSSPGGRLLGIDADPEAIAIASQRLEAYGDSCLLINQNFVNLEAICIKYDFLPVHGILFDLGLSSLQLDNSARGFSFQSNGLLDMRLSPEQEFTAADIINTFSEAELARLIRTYGEETHSRQIARQIVAERPIATTLQLAQIIEPAVGGRRGKIHPATRTFQALRIAVNHELENLDSALKQAVNLLGYEGRLVVISYHSLEDRIVKQFMRQESSECICPPGTPVCVCGHTRSLRLVNKRVITPSPAEVQLNPRSRSAKLRAAERIITPEDYFQTTDRLCFLAEFETVGWRRPTILRRLQRTFAVA
jgi:16S rRNA (cytosine1402-N4)-methyltransferase